LAKDHQDLAFDFREVAPAKAFRDMYVREGAVLPGLSTDGALAVAVPGAIKGYLELHAKYGTLPRAKVLAPAIRAARDGFFVTPKYKDMANARLECLRKDPEAARIFLRPGVNGVPAAPEVGVKLTQPDLAKTLEALAKSGDAPFYSGALSKLVVDSVQKGGGLLDADDLKKFTTRWRTPLVGSYRGYRLVTMPPPSAGGIALLQVLGVLEAHGATGPANRDVDTLHVTIEALRRAYVDRATYLGDPAFNDLPLEKLVSKPYLEAMLATIDPHKATKSTMLMPEALRRPASDAGVAPAPKNTSHLSVIDAVGNAVSMTTTVNTAFGSCLVAKGTGILLNNQMDDFASAPGVPNSYGLVQGEANSIAAGKVPLSSMTPTLVFQKEKPNEVLLAVGSPGGSTIPTTVLQVISNVLDAHLDVVRAVGAGRIHHQWLPDDVLVDKNGLEPATAKALEAMGHSLKRIEGWGDGEAVMVDPITSLRTAASDPRNEGSAAGQD
jgi:gamma-glutamyltranspeptidase/glutathione hydrolase